MFILYVFVNYIIVYINCVSATSLPVVTAESNDILETEIFCH